MPSDGGRSLAWPLCEASDNDFLAEDGPTR